MTSDVPFPEVVDASMLTEMKACAHKGFRKYFEHYKPVGRSEHLHAGKAFASGLEAARVAFYSQKQSQVDSEAIGLGKLLEEYGDFQPPQDSAKTKERMVGAYEFYFDQWPLGSDSCQPITLQHSEGKRGIEVICIEPLPVLHPTTGQPILYSARADMLANFASGLYVEDDKTANSLGQRWVQQWDLRSQFMGLTWVVEKGFGQRPKGVLVRGVAILKTQYNSAQAIVNFAPWQIEEWLEGTCDLLLEMIENWKRGYWRKNLDHSCADWGGCEFKSTCLSSNPAPWLNQYFERRKWDPVTRTETLL